MQFGPDERDDAIRAREMESERPTIRPHLEQEPQEGAAQPLSRHELSHGVVFLGAESKGEAIGPLADVLGGLGHETANQRVVGSALLGRDGGHVTGEGSRHGGNLTGAETLCQGTRQPCGVNYPFLSNSLTCRATIDET